MVEELNLLKLEYWKVLVDCLMIRGGLFDTV